MNNNKIQTNERKKICLLSDHHLSMNPRLWKEAFFYEKEGFEVIILTMWQSKNSLEKDFQILAGHAISYQSYLNLIPGEVNPISRFFYRARKKIAGQLQKYFKISTSWAISHSPKKMFLRAMHEKANLYSAHLECAFFVGRNLIKAGKKVSFDFEDWYSRDYLVPERPVKLLAALEGFAIGNGLFCTAASQSMASALEDCYPSKNIITALYNGFSSISDGQSPNDRKDNLDKAPVNLLWFSRTIGPDRGIELLLKGLQVLDKPVNLHLLGEMTEGYESILQNTFPFAKGHSLVIHPFIPHSQLPGFIGQFKIGLAIEENINDNRQLTITNKILQYLQSGLLVLASDTKGQREVAGLLPQSVTIVDIGKPIEIATAIKALIEKEFTIQSNQHSQFEEIFSWEAQEKKIKKLTEQYL
jgi:glycosyltransferase involved in cell wall biosynthesis